MNSRKGYGYIYLVFALFNVYCLFLDYYNIVYVVKVYSTGLRKKLLYYPFLECTVNTLIKML